MTINLAEIRKFLVGLAALGGEALTTGLVHGTARSVLQVGIAAIGAVLTWIVPNAQPAAKT